MLLDSTSTTLRDASLDSLKKLGANIRRARKEAFKESREVFAARIGCSALTLDKLERGEPGVSCGYLMAALHVCTVAHDVVDATSPDPLIATLVPASFPASIRLDSFSDS